jgi:hypothetical protein
MNEVTATAIETALVVGDLSKLSVEARLSYYNNVCTSTGLNPLTKPFEYIVLNGKMVLYAKKDATDQLRRINKVSLTIVSRELVEGVYVVVASATLPDGRKDESIGAVPVQNLKGADMANAIMKSETKAKRRVTLSICGLGFLDESEIETISAEVVAPVQSAQNPDEYKANPGEYIVTIGTKYKGKKLSEVPISEVDSFRKWLKNKAQQEQKPLIGGAKLFVEMAENYLTDLDDDYEEEPHD